MARILKWRDGTQTVSRNAWHDEAIERLPQTEAENDRISEEQQSEVLPLSPPLTKENLRAVTGEPPSPEEPYTEPFPELTPQPSPKAVKKTKRKRKNILLDRLKKFVPNPILKACRRAMYVLGVKQTICWTKVD